MMASRRSRNRRDKRAETAEMQRAGWPPGMLQDDSRELSRWFSERPGARRLADEAAQDARVPNAKAQARPEAKP